MYVFGVINNVLSRDSNCIVNEDMRPKFDHSSSYIKEVIHKDLTRKIDFFEGWSSFKLND